MNIGEFYEDSPMRSNHLSDSHYTAAFGDLGKCQEIVGRDWQMFKLPESSTEIEISLTHFESNNFTHSDLSPDIVSGNGRGIPSQPRGGETIKQMYLDLQLAEQ